MIDAKEARKLFDATKERQQKKIEDIIEAKVRECIFNGKNSFPLTSEEMLLKPLHEIQYLLKKYNFNVAIIDDQKERISYLQVSF